jgi:hypothetical protein
LPNLVALVMEATRSSETSVLTRATRHSIQENGILHSHRREKPQISLKWGFSIAKLRELQELKDTAQFSYWHNDTGSDTAVP